MIRFVQGDIFEAQTNAIVNTVNLVGVMGKGLALQFKERFKENFFLYKKACENTSIGIGKSLVVTEHTKEGREILIINFPTKTHWRKPSQYQYIEKGLDNLIDIIRLYSINSIAIPPLGAGNGGLDWNIVRQLIVDKLSSIPCDIYIYEPGHKPASVTKNVSLTPARALMLYMLKRLEQEGCDATQFSAVKTVYFLQKFGAHQFFRLKFEPYIYGPYNDAVRHVLHGLDGAYIRGFADMSKKPFEPFGLIQDKFQEVDEIIEKDSRLSEIVAKTCNFLDGYWDDFNLELLSSVDYLMSQHPNADVGEIYERLNSWSLRKKELFADRNFTEKAFSHIATHR